MEVKVWVDEIPRVVSGATYDTTCQDVVIALAQALGRTGRFSLIERWRNSSRPLTPAEFPLRVLHKWGEYAPEVHLVLCQVSAEDGKPPHKDKLGRKRGEQPADVALQTHGTTRPGGAASVKRSLTFTGACSRLPQTSASASSSAPTTKFRKTQKGSVPNGDALHLSGSAPGSRRSPPPVPKQSLGSAQVSGQPPQPVPKPPLGSAQVSGQPPQPVPKPPLGSAQVSGQPPQPVPKPPLGSAQVSGQPPQPVPKQQRRARGDQQQARQSGTAQHPPHPVPPPRHHSSVAHAQPAGDGVANSASSASQPSTAADLALSSSRSTVVTHQPVPAARSHPVTSASPAAESQPLLESLPSLQLKPQVSPRARVQSQTQSAVKPTQGSQEGIFHPQAQHAASSVLAPPKPTQGSEELIFRPQAQHAKPSVLAPPKPMQEYQEPVFHHQAQHAASSVLAPPKPTPGSGEPIFRPQAQHAKPSVLAPPKPTQGSEEPIFRPQAEHTTPGVQAPPKPTQEYQEPVFHPQAAQHASHSPQPPPLPLSPPPSAAVVGVVASSPVLGSDGDPDKAPGAEGAALVSLDQDPLESSERSSHTSLEIEEYDLEHNFPDTHREFSHPERPSVSLEYRLEDGMRSGSGSGSGSGSEGQHDVEHARLQELVHSLQEQLKEQESQIGTINTEISTLEGKEKEYEEKLHVIMEDLLLYENRHRDLETQLDDLEKVEWANVLDGEKKCEVDLTLKIASMKASILEHEGKLADLRVKESQLLGELKEEEEKLRQEREQLKAEEAKAREEEEERAKEEISKLQASLTEEHQRTAEYEALLWKVDSELKSVEEDLTEKQRAVSETEVRLKGENMKNFGTQPAPKEGGAKSLEQSGETVLKILEGRLSPRPQLSASSKTGDGPRSPPFITALTSSNPSGVWV